jgi:hypothetical protein
MAGLAQNQELLRLAAKYIWWTSPEAVVADGITRLVSNVMELGTWEDASSLLEIIGRDRFISVLKSPPAGIISDKSLAFWHYRLGMDGLPPKSRRRFN